MEGLLSIIRKSPASITDSSEVEVEEEEEEEEEDTSVVVDDEEDITAGGDGDGVGMDGGTPSGLDRSSG